MIDVRRMRCGLLRKRNSGCKEGMQCVTEQDKAPLRLYGHNVQNKYNTV